MASDEASQDFFKKLKENCVPLLGQSSLTPASIPKASELLTKIIITLREAQQHSALVTSLISYVFFPIGTILRRNAPATIPDQVLEKIFTVLALLSEAWWWDMDVKTWEQIFMLCGAVLAGFDAKGKGKERADETREAAVQCLWALMRPRRPDEDPLGTHSIFVRSGTVFAKFQTRAQTRPFLPILGQSVDSLLACSESRHPSLQRSSLKLLQVVIQEYIPDGLVPSILPGVVSVMCKVALAAGSHKTWANGDVVADALATIQEIAVRAIGDDVCIRDGAVKGVQDLEDLLDLDATPKAAAHSDTENYSTARTAAWLRGTSAQLHIALNSLKHLVTHPSATALHSLVNLSATVLRATTLTLPQSQPLLLSFLFSLSCSEYESISSDAAQRLAELLDSTTQSVLLPVVLQIFKDCVISLPRLLSSRSDTKVEHVAKVIEGICRVAIIQHAQSKSAISSGIGKLLGPSGGVERWGWSLLSVLELSTPPVATASSFTARLMLENDIGETGWQPFPPVNLVLLTSQSAQASVEHMFRSLGNAARDGCLYAVEWFFNIGRGRADSRAIAALWCGCRLLEGAARISLDAPVSIYTSHRDRSRRAIEKFARGMAKSFAEMWDREDIVEVSQPTDTGQGQEEDVPVVEHLSGLVLVRTPMEVAQKIEAPKRTSERLLLQPDLQKALVLQALAISAGILQSRFTPLLLDTLYPVLHSIVAKSPHLSSTALATLHYFTQATSHASPSNLLLSNFDYALDAVSRHLGRRWLDVDAATVLVILVRLVGRDVVSKAGDVVDECFDRLDEYHGYSVVVDGLIAVLSEVVDVIGMDDTNRLDRKPAQSPEVASLPKDPMSDLLHWLAHRNDKAETDNGQEDFGPVPREAWGKPQEDDEHAGQALDPTDEPPVTPTQALVQQIVSRSLFFLTHGSPAIRAHILTLLARATPVLPESALLPSIHHAWPYILNRFSDKETLVLSAAASLVEALATHVGEFMYRRIWDDIWPRFRRMIVKLDAADASSALARRAYGNVGTESAYTHSHRLYKAILRTMTATAKGVQVHDNACWDVIVVFRRFLHKHVHEELQLCARELYKAMLRNNEDAVWLALSATRGDIAQWSFLCEEKWDVDENISIILSHE